MAYIIIDESTRNNKKFMATIFNKKGGYKINTVHFGQKGASDFPRNKDKNRKENYLSRHQKNEDWTVSGVNTAGFWSRWLLWNKRSLRASKNDIERRFNISVKLMKSVYEAR